MESLNLDRVKACFQWRHSQARGSDDTMLTGEDENSEASITENEESSTFETPPQEPQHLSTVQRLCFAASLFLCAFTVIIFGFLLPCHQPGCDKTNSCPVNASADWSVKFANSTPCSIHFLDIGGNGYLDVIVEATRDFKNGTCSTEITALSGELGNSLWLSRRDSKLGRLTCTDPQQTQHPSCLLVEGSSQLLKIDIQTGSVEWSSTQHMIYAYEFVADVDGDGAEDIVVLHDIAGKNLSEAGRTNLTILCGKTGKALGIPATVPGKQSNSSILLVYNVSKGTQYILVGSSSGGQQAGSLWAIPTAGLARKMGPATGDKNLSHQWGPYFPDQQTGFILLLDGVVVTVKPLLVDLNLDGLTDLVVCVKKPGLIVLALDGKTLGTLWNITLLTSDIQRLIATSASKDSHQTDIAMVIQSANNTTELQVIDGLSGEITWSFHSDAVFSVPPVGVHYSSEQGQAFLVWLPGNEAVKYIGNEQQKQYRRRESIDDGWSLLTHKSNEAFYNIASEMLESHRTKTGDQGGTKHMQNNDGVTRNEETGDADAQDSRKRESAVKVKRDDNSYQGYGLQSAHSDCDSKSLTEEAMFSAFLVSHDEAIKVQHVTSVKAMYLDAKEYENLFGQKGPTHQCVKFVPRNVLEPLEGVVGYSGEPGLVFAVEFVEESAGSNHLMKVNKINLQRAAGMH